MGEQNPRKETQCFSELSFLPTVRADKTYLVQTLPVTPTRKWANLWVSFVGG